MKAHEERVVVEKKELDDKIEKLGNFILGLDDNRIFETLPEGEQSRLRIQLQLMGAYSTVLGERIAAFPA